MAYGNFQVPAKIFILLCIVLGRVYSQKCVAGVKNIDIVERAYRSEVVVRARVTIPGKQSQTAQVTSVFGTKTGGLSPGDTLVFGPIEKGKRCRIKKNTEYILFLESNEPGSNLFKVKYDPVSKMREAKKLRKVLCEGCVKPPKFKQRNKSVQVMEGKSFTFNCKVSGYPKPKALFLKDSIPLPTRTKGMIIKIKKKGGGGKLKIKKVDASHTGVYTCQASNFAGNASLSYALTVKELCIPCNEKDTNTYCLNGGRCCTLSHGNEPYCRCDHNYGGPRCENKILITYDPRKAVEARYHRQTVAIMGVCIALLLVILICYIVYCKFKKSRSHILKDIQKQYSPVSGRDTDREEERPIANANSEGIVGDDSNDSEVRLTEYRSTNLTESPYDRKPLAFSQRPQTYDDVIPVMGTGSASTGHKHHPGYVNREESGRRKRKNGVAVENRGYIKQTVTASDGDMSSKGDRRVDELKRNRNRDSMISTSSSVGSHHELRRPAIPIDESIQRLATMSVHVPPAYGDIPDSGGRQERASSHDSTDQPLTSSHPTRIEMNSSSQTDQSKEFGISPPSSVGRLNEFDSEGRAEEEIPNNHQPMQLSTPVFSSDYLPKSNQNSTIHGQEPGSGYISPRSEVPYKQNIQSPPYYEPNAEKQLHSPPSYRHSDESSHVKAADHAVTPGSPYYDNHRGSQPSSPRQYQNNSGMGIPHHHAPIAVASARTHVLPLLSDESHDLQNRSLLGSAVSLTSSASEDESSEPERNRDSRKIEV